jgi:hypothetical protein
MPRRYRRAATGTVVLDIPPMLAVA